MCQSADCGRWPPELCEEVALRTATSQYEQLIESGFCVFEDVLTEPLLTDVRARTTELCAARSPAERSRRRAQGTMLSVMAEPLLAELVAWPRALDRLAALGFAKPTFTDGYVIGKPPRSPRLFWHYDWFAWRDPGARDIRPQQVFLMYYLDDTTPANGCLRVLPGSHRTHRKLHDEIGNPHGEALSRVLDPAHPAFATQPDEVDVPVRAGDLVIGDARLLHAAHANDSDCWRIVVTLWFQPEFHGLPERVQAQMARKTQAIPGWWPDPAAAKVRALNPTYAGDAEPYGRDLYQRPDPRPPGCRESS